MKKHQIIFQHGLEIMQDGGQQNKLVIQSLFSNSTFNEN